MGSEGKDSSFIISGVSAEIPRTLQVHTWRSRLSANVDCSEILVSQLTSEASTGPRVRVLFFLLSL